MHLAIRAIKDQWELRETMACQVKMEVLEERVLWDPQETRESQEQEVEMEGLEEWEDLDDREIQVLWDHLGMWDQQDHRVPWASKVNKEIQVLLESKASLVDWDLQVK